MNDARIQEIINESINNLLISEGLFSNNKELNYIKQVVDKLNGTLSSLSKGVTANQVVFMPNPNGSINDPHNQFQQNYQSQNTNVNNDDIIFPDENGEQTIYDGDALDMQEAKGGRGRKRTNVRGNLGNKKAKPQPKPQPTPTSQYQPQPQQQLTPEQQEIQTKLPEVIRCWNMGKQIISETVSLLKSYLALNGIKEGKLYEDANGTMVNPWQILKGGYQSGKSGYLRGYRQGYRLIDKFKRMKNKYNALQRSIKSKEQAVARLRQNIQNYLNFCKIVDDCPRQIEIVTANVVFGQEVKIDIYIMSGNDIRKIYDQLKNMKSFKEK